MVDIYNIFWGSPFVYVTVDQSCHIVLNQIENYQYIQEVLKINTYKAWLHATVSCYEYPLLFVVFSSDMTGTMATTPDFISDFSKVRHCSIFSFLCSVLSNLFSLGSCVVCLSSIYGSLLFLWCLHTLSISGYGTDVQEIESSYYFNETGTFG